MKKQDLGAYILLTAAGVGCYANALGNGFVFDDQAYIGSASIQHFKLLTIFLENWLHLDLFRPLTLVSLAGDYRLYQTDPAGYHLSNLLLHLLNGVLFYELARRVIESRLAALVGALFYVAHPLQTEVVNWISARGDLLAGLFIMAGLLFHLRSEEQPERVRWRLLAWSCFAGGLLAKETAVIFPAVVWWRDWCHRDSGAELRSVAAFTGKWLQRQSGYFLVLGAVLAWRWLMVGAGMGEGGPVSANFLASTPLVQRSLTVGSIFLRYLILMVFPARLSADYSQASIPLVTSFLDPWFLGGLLAGVTLICSPLWWHSRGFVFTWGFFWLALLPVSNLFLLAPSGMAERYLHLALVPICLTGGLAIQAWLKLSLGRHWRYAGWLLIAVGLLACGARTVGRNRDWHSGSTLFSAVLRVFPDNARGHENLGYAYYRRNELLRAVEHYKAAIAIRPDQVRTHYTLGVLYSKLQRYEAAERALKTALFLNTRHVEAHFSLGLIYHKTGRYPDAIRHYQDALQLAPDHDRAATNLTRAHEQAGWPQE